MRPTQAHEAIRARGPRWAVAATVNKDWIEVTYADNGDDAERIRELFADRSYRMISVLPPVDGIELDALGRARTEAKRAFDEATAVLRAGVLRAIENGRAEAEIARTAGIDRMTVRSWAGK